MHSVSKYLIGTHMISHLFGIRVSRKEHTEHRKRERERQQLIAIDPDFYYTAQVVIVG